MMARNEVRTKNNSSNNRKRLFILYNEENTGA
jgi:hypothetical protein